MEHYPLMKWLKKIDRYLLLNRQVLWETRGHYFLAYILASYVLVFLGTYCWPLSLNAPYPESVGITTCIAIVNTLVFVYWIYKNSLYSTERNFGATLKSTAQTKFLVYFGIASLLILMPLLPSYVLDKRIDQLVSNEELLMDIKILNEGNIYFPHKKTHFKTDHQDDIFECVAGGVYNTSIFGEAAIDQDARRNKEQHGVIGQMEGKAMLESAMGNETQAHEKITAYIQVFMKYSDAEKLAFSEPQEVYHAFENKLYLAHKLNKSWVKRRVSAIRTHKSKALYRANYYIEHVSVFIAIAFFAAMLVQISKQTDLKSFISAIVANIALCFGVGMVTALLRIGLRDIVFGFSKTDSFVLVTGLLAIGFLVGMKNITRLKRYTRAYSLMLITVQFYSSFVFLYWAKMMNDWIREETAITMIYLGMFVYVAILLPIFSRMHLKLRALPRS